MNKVGEKKNITKKDKVFSIKEKMKTKIRYADDNKFSPLKLSIKLSKLWSFIK